ncbi:PadR family transcriptional regulator [Glaciecola sp. 33A]|jgi:DNA-binding PadR family transcriptional regulator|uniref:PadR family transcriptional regulator n=1 Tax=Glaciecola sp. 33A TaxID=2057807 RepID=UPI000C33DDC5|nr:helix-turn-helix transcriptional regulator [Glaciecola sp. 33A]PKI02671.1 PadR family transcriptional regulator [Glaciecola sp. 33A]
MSLSKDLVAASSTPLILSILDHNESYGYAIIQQVHQLSNGEIQWADGMLYPILHRMEKKGWIESFWGKADTGRKRKYYRLCPTGVDELIQQRQQWQKLSSMISHLEK